MRPAVPALAQPHMGIHVMHHLFASVPQQQERAIVVVVRFKAFCCLLSEMVSLLALCRNLFALGWGAGCVSRLFVVKMGPRFQKPPPLKIRPVNRRQKGNGRQLTAASGYRPVRTPSPPLQTKHEA